jgi:TetR/AcrR family transcriptional regulator, fatty acid metabolism regulator protein
LSAFFLDKTSAKGVECLYRTVSLRRSVKRMGEAKNIDVKEAIIRESIKLFLAKGYRGTSVKEITGAAGIGRGTLYWYFKSKDEILMSIFDKWEKAFVDGLRDAVNNKKGDFTAKYKAFHKFSTEFARDERELAIVFNTLLNEIVGSHSPAETAVKAVHERYWRVLESMLEEGKKEGTVSKDIDSLLYAHVIAASHTGMLVEWFASDDDLAVGPFVRAFRDIILRSVTGG